MPITLVPRRRIGRLLVLSALACVASGAAGATAAHAAGSVVLYTADGLEDCYEEVLPAFERKEGVRVAIVTAGSGEVVNRATVERDNPKADVIVTLPPFVQQAAAAGLLQPFEAQADAHVAGRAADGAWRTFVDNYFCFDINPDVVKTLPRSFADLLKPEFKGKVAYSNPATAGDGMAVIILTIAALGGEDQAFDYLKRLESSVKFHTRGTGYLDVLLSRREISVANGDVQMSLGDAAGGGLSVAPVFPAGSDGEQPLTFSLPYAIGLVSHAPHDAVGRKLIDYLLSSEVQAKVGTVYGIPARDDARREGQNADAVRKLMQGVKVIPVDWTEVGQEKATWLRRFKDEVAGNSGKQTIVSQFEISSIIGAAIIARTISRILLNDQHKV